MYKKILIFSFLILIMASAWYILAEKKEPSETGEVRLKIKEGIEPQKSLERIGWITDLHADDSGQIAINDEQVIYASAFETYLSEFIKKMEAEDIRTVIVTGDMTHDGEDDIARQIRKITDRSDIKFVWVKGNHDKEENHAMREFDVDKPYYYHYDTAFTRIIVLNVVDEEDDVSQKQARWLEDSIKGTPLNVIVAMHAPIVNYEEEKIYDKFSEIERIMRESGKVKMVVSGSLHKEKELELGGILYKTAYPLTLEDHMGSYYIIEIGKKTRNIRAEKLKLQD